MAQPTLVQSKILNVGGTATPSGSFDTNVTAGNILIVSASSYLNSSQTTTHDSVTDGGDTFVRQGTSQVTGGGSDNYVFNVFVAENVAGGAVTITINCGNSCSTGFILMEFTNPAGTSVIDLVAQAVGTSTAPSATFAGPTTVAEAAILGCMTHNSGNPSITPNGTNLPIQIQENEDNGSSEAQNASYRQVSSIATYTGNWALSASAPWCAKVIAIKGTAAAQDTPETRGRPYGLAGHRQQAQLLSR